MKSNYKIYEENGNMVIERTVFPRLKGVITFGSESDIEHINMIDDCADPLKLASVMREMGEYIAESSQNQNPNHLEEQ